MASPGLCCSQPPGGRHCRQAFREARVAVIRTEPQARPADYSTTTCPSVALRRFASSDGDPAGHGEEGAVGEVLTAGPRLAVAPEAALLLCLDSAASQDSSGALATPRLRWSLSSQLVHFEGYVNGFRRSSLPSRIALGRETPRTPWRRPPVCGPGGAGPSWYAPSLPTTARVVEQAAVVAVLLAKLWLDGVRAHRHRPDRNRLMCSCTADGDLRSVAGPLGL
jgi:hypothetical protein